MRLLSKDDAKDIEFLFNLNNREVLELKQSILNEPNDKLANEGLERLKNMKEMIEDTKLLIPTKHVAGAYESLGSTGSGEYFIGTGEEIKYLPLSPDQLIIKTHDHVEEYLKFLDKVIKDCESKLKIVKKDIIPKSDLSYDRDTGILHYRGQANHMIMLMILATVREALPENKKEFRDIFRPYEERIFVKNKNGKKAKLLYYQDGMDLSKIRERYSDAEIADMTSMIIDFISPL